MAIISGVMQMAGTREQVEDVGDARTALSSLLGVSESVRVLWYLIRNATLLGVACNPITATMEPKMQQRQQKYTVTWTHYFRRLVKIRLTRLPVSLTQCSENWMFSMSTSIIPPDPNIRYDFFSCYHIRGKITAWWLVETQTIISWCWLAEAGRKKLDSCFKRILKESCPETHRFWVLSKRELKKIDMEQWTVFWWKNKRIFLLTCSLKHT